MKDQHKTEMDYNLLFSSNKLQNKYIDEEKLALLSKDIQLGISNYFLFQNFFNFKWPLWLYNTYSVKSKIFNPVCPFLLLNNNNRDWISFSNTHLSNRVLIDPSGMISPFDDRWSIEFWLVEKDILCRPQERISSVLQNMDMDTFIINTKWKETNFELVESIYGIDNETDDLAVEINNILQKGNLSACLLIVIRPYNLMSLGGIKSIELNNKTRVVKINGLEKIYLENKPDFVFSGNVSVGDIEFDRNAGKIENVECSFGMATLAFGYSLTKGSNEYRLRVNLSDSRKINAVKLDYSRIKKCICRKM